MSDDAKDTANTPSKADPKTKAADADKAAVKGDEGAKAKGEDKSSLKDLAEQDSAKSKSGAKPSAKSDTKGSTKTDKSGAKAKSENATGKGVPSKGGGGFMWVVLVLVVIGGAVTAGWPYIGPKVQPVVADVRDLMGLGPRPTQVTMPDAAPSQAAAPSNEEAPSNAASDVLADTTAMGTGNGPSDPASTTPDAADMSAPEAPDMTATSAVSPADVDALKTEIEVLKSRIEAMGTQGPGSGENAQAALDAAAELNRAIASLQNDVQALASRVDQLEQRPRTDPTAPAQALVLATTQLRSRLIGDQPFTAELDALQNIAGDDPAVRDAIQRLKPHAAVGIPTEATLTARYDKVAKQIVAARTTGEAEGWLGRVKDGLGGLVTVRRTDPQAITDDIERAVAVAEAALELGDLAEAVEALSGLENAPGDAAAAWLGDARARVEAEAALEELHGHALAALSAAGGN